MADRVVDELVVNAVWPGEFDLAYGAAVAARVMELDTASDPDQWKLNVWPSGARDMVISDVPEDMAGYLAGGLEGRLLAARE